MTRVRLGGSSSPESNNQRRSTRIARFSPCEWGATYRGAGVGIGILGSKFLEGAARQPELVPMLQARMFLMLGLTDAVPIIAIAFAALMMFANPFIGQIAG